MNRLDLVIPFLNRLLHWAIVGIVSPVLVLMILSKGVMLGQAGFVMATMSAMVVIVELPGGVLSDLAGRKRIYLLALAVSAAGYVFMFHADSLVGVMLAVILYGMSRALSSGSIEALYIDSFIGRYGKERLHILMTAMNIGEALGLSAGALAGGYIPLVWSRLYPEQNRYNGNLVVQTFLLAVLAFLTVLPRRFVDRAAGSAGTDARTGTGGVMQLARDVRLALFQAPVLVRLLAGSALWGAAFSIIETYWQPRLDTLPGVSGTSWLFGIIGSAYFAAAIAGNMIAGVATGKLSVHSGLAIIGSLRIAAGIAVALLAAQTGVPGFITFFLAVMCLNGMMTVPEGTAFNASVPEKTRASFLSMASLMVQAGSIGAAAVSSLALRFVPLGVVLGTAGALLAASSQVYFGVPGHRQSGLSGQR